MYIRETSDSDLNDILLIESVAFNSNEEDQLVQTILADPIAKPLLSHSIPRKSLSRAYSI